MSEEASLRSSVWRLIAESAGVAATSAERTTPVELVGTNRRWQPVLIEAARGTDPGCVIFVAFDRGLAKAFLGLFAHRVWRRVSSPSFKHVVRALDAAGMQVEQRYALWPSVQGVRVALQQPAGPSLVWLQRSGVLGGGGRRIWGRVLARSWLLTPFLRLLTPGVALVARRE